MALYVNGERVEEKEIQAEVERLKPDYQRVFGDQSPEEQYEQLYAWSKENVIERVLLRQAARAKVTDVDDETVEKAFENLVEQAGGKAELLSQAGLAPGSEDKVRQDIADRMKTEKLIEKITADVGEPTKKQIEKYYQKNLERFTIPEMIRASHIVLHPSPDVDRETQYKEMEETLSKLKKGEAFDTLAQQHSACPENGGDLGYFPRGQMVQSFEDVVFNMKVGETSEIFETEFGYHIAKVTDHKESTPCPLDDVREVIVKELTEQAKQKALEKFVDAQKERATIEEKD
ncbi:Foldase protein PrsA 1 precursor [Anaerohalosphaera lusitana]|uniref:Foldase protein PrsA 1 n=1 Tax=Anaerohalosphaera lusitana TaxID=1936003 RepID=A0A1U9NGE6_9BACT|nr:peptidylprolyl isomerase [Anaerohalosphaera lusitana]AQT67003.1 Foldase protein PrsA 1 precursor [Anaerohalosphaera lusitana]